MANKVFDVKIGINPISWSNDDLPSLGGETPLSTALTEGRAIGYQGFELGNKFPREPAALRDRLARLGVTMMSAGSHTEPGGYTGAGSESLHVTTRGKAQPVIASEGEHLSATEQFSISDERSPAEVSARLRELGLEPVWKDWDAALAPAS